MVLSTGSNRPDTSLIAVTQATKGRSHRDSSLTKVTHERSSNRPDVQLSRGRVWALLELEVRLADVTTSSTTSHRQKGGLCALPLVHIPLDVDDIDKLRGSSHFVCKAILAIPAGRA
jgi:hypothetical protein